MFGPRPHTRSTRTTYRPALLELEPRLVPSADVLTYHNDNARAGANLAETTLTPALVNASDFGQLFTDAVNGAVYAQPLYKSGVNVPGRGSLDLVFVATEHDSVYAFDANHPGPAVWQDSFINPAAGVTTVADADLHSSSISPEVGITGTPVIDPTTGTLFVVAFTKEVTGGNTTFVQRLHALDLATGAEKLGGPVVIQATAPGSGQGGDGATVTFDALHQNQRPGLLLDNGVVYITWASFDDRTPYHGWVIGYNAQTLQQVAVFDSTPDGGLGGIWQAGAAPAADAQGNIYLVTGNGTFDAGSPAAPNDDYGDSFLKLTPTPAGLTVTSFFTPFNQNLLDARDEDLGSGGPVLLPDQAGPSPQLLVGAGKEGKVYLLDRNSLGGFNPSADHVVQELPGAVTSAFDTPAYFNGAIYYGGVGDTLKAFNLSGGLLSAGPTQATSQSFGYPGATPSVSANGSTDGIVWVVQNGPTAVLRAFAAGDLGTELYDSSQAGMRDQLGPGVKFAVPTIVNGKVYVATQTGLAVFGLLTNVVVNGTAGDDTLVVQRTAGAGSGSITYVLNGGAPVTLVGVNTFTFNGLDGNDVLTVSAASGAPVAGGAIGFDGGSGSNALVLDAAGQVLHTGPGRVTIAGPQDIVYVNAQGIGFGNAAGVNAAAAPDTADRATALPGLTAGQRFVQTLFLDDLGRPGSAAELKAWAGLLDGTPTARLVVAADIAHSWEGYDHLARTWYLTYLGRPAGNGEEQTWVNALAAGQTQEQVLSTILDSTEFFQRAQTLVSTGNTWERYVGALYALLLDRMPPTAELEGWVNLVPQEGFYGVAMAFLASQEFRADQIAGYYDVLLHRPADDAGLAGWSMSGLDLGTVAIVFESSQEFLSDG